MAGAPSAAPSAVAEAAAEVERGMAAEEDEAELAELRERLEQLLGEQDTLREGTLSAARKDSASAHAVSTEKASTARSIKDRHKQLKDGIKAWQDEYKAKHGQDPTAEAKLEIKDDFTAYKQSSALSKEAKAEAKAAEDAASAAESVLRSEEAKDEALQTEVEDVQARIEELEAALGAARDSPRQGQGRGQGLESGAAVTGSASAAASEEQHEALRREIAELREQLVRA